MERFEFDGRAFVTSTEEQNTELSPQTLNELIAIRSHYPELSHWSRNAIFVAWGDYSQDIYAISWVDWMTGYRDEGFLAYCYVRQLWPSFNFGGSGLFDDNVQALGEEQPWEQSPLPSLPDWVYVETGR